MTQALAEYTESIFMPRHRKSVRPSAVHRSCPLHNFVTGGDNFTKLGINIKHDQTMCRD